MNKIKQYVYYIGIIGFFSLLGILICRVMYYFAVNMLEEGVVSLPGAFFFGIISYIMLLWGSTYKNKTNEES